MKKIIIDEQIFLEEYNKGLNDVELSKLFNCSSETIRNKRKSLQLNKNFEYSQQVNKVQLEDLVKQGLSDYKIGNLLNLSHSWVFQLRKKWNLDRKDLKFSKLIPLTKKQEEILIGHILGDGHLRNNWTNISGKIEQGYKQKAYAEWKYNELKNLCSDFKFYKRKTIDNRTGLYYESYGATILANPDLNKYYNLFYNNDGIKYISKEIMNLFTPLSLAVMFMDDGTKTPSGYRLCTQCFSLQDLNLLVDKLLDMNIFSTICKDNTLYIPSKSKDVFTYLIKPYIIPSMLYKLH